MELNSSFELMGSVLMDNVLTRFILSINAFFMTTVIVYVIIQLTSSLIIEN